ncbi:MAG: hypothetical protein RL219_1529 [Actinomycetota bacterium]
MPPTCGTHLHHIGRVIVSSALQLHDFGTFGDETTVPRQTMTEHIGEQDHVRVIAHLAACLCCLTEVAGGADQLWVSVAHSVATHPSALELVQQGATSETVVDDAGSATEHVDREAHGSQRYF